MIPLRSLVRYGSGVVNASLVVQRQSTACYLRSSSVSCESVSWRKFSTEVTSEKVSSDDVAGGGGIAAEAVTPIKSKKQDTSPLTTERPREKIQLDKLYKTLELEVLAYEPSVLNSYQWFVVTAATHLGIPVGKCWSPLKSDKLRFPLLKSAFVHKKHQVQYEVRTYHRFLTFHKLTGSTADTFLEYVERNLPEGVGLKVTKVEVQSLPDYLHNKQPT